MADIRWSDAKRYSNLELDQLAASRWQHRIAYAINERVLFDYDSLVDYAQFSGVNYARLGRLLRGEAVIRLEDVATAERVLGLKLIGD